MLYTSEALHNKVTMMTKMIQDIESNIWHIINMHLCINECVSMVNCRDLNPKHFSAYIKDT